MTREDLEKVPSPADETQVAPLPVIGPADGAGPAAGAPGSPGAGPAPDPDQEDDEDVEARLAMESLARHRRARRRKRLVAGGVVAAVALAGVVAYAALTGASSGPEEAPALQTMPLYLGEFSESVQATGTAQPLSSVVVTPEVDGIVETVNVAEGSVVSEGDVLLTIRNDDLDRAVREAEINVRSQRAALSSAREAYDQTYRDYGTFDPTYDAEGNQTGSERRASWADVQQAQAAVDSAELSLEGAQQTYDQAVETAGKRTVTAPASGSVVSMSAVPGAALGAGAQGGGTGSLVQIADLSQMTVSVQVNEVDISRVAEGQAARVSFSALPGVMLDGQVTRISSVASSDEYGMNYGVVTYDVEILIPTPDPALKPGMTASVEILLQSVPDTLTVPVSALMTDDGASYYVYVMTDPETQAVERRDVSVAAQSATTAAISGDVAEGELVVLDPFSVDPASVGGAGATGGAGDDADDGATEGVASPDAEAGTEADATPDAVSAEDPAAAPGDPADAATTDAPTA